MSNYFADTSALAKRYLAEVGSRWVVSWIIPSASHVIVVSELVFVEMRSLLERRVREKSLAASNVVILKGNFQLHYSNEYLSVLLDTGILEDAARLADKHPLRALDAIQLASAIHAWICWASQ